MVVERYEFYLSSGESNILRISAALSEILISTQEDKIQIFFLL